MGNAGDDNLQGRDGNDILEGGDGRDELHGGKGDDTLFGGSNDDNLYGDDGHDAMSGGDGNDTFHVDADDLDGTNTLDGVHSIDGGDGTDTVQLGGLASFDSNDAKHVENVEVLDFKVGGRQPRTAITLDYSAIYGITQVGGLHALTIHADGPGAGADTVNLQNTAGKDWTFAGNDGTFNNYTAGIGATQVTVHVDKDAAVNVA